MLALYEHESLGGRELIIRGGLILFNVICHESLCIVLKATLSGIAGDQKA